jgi:hypothetical protein
VRVGFCEQFENEGNIGGELGWHPTRTKDWEQSFRHEFEEAFNKKK